MLECPVCGESLPAFDSLGRHSARCPTCGEPVNVARPVAVRAARRSRPSALLWSLIIGGLVSAVIAVLAVAVMVSARRGSAIASDDVSSSREVVGGMYRVYSNVGNVTATTDRFAMVALLKAGNARDIYGVKELHDGGRAFNLDAGTLVKLLERNDETCELRVLEGQHKGERVFVLCAGLELRQTDH